MALGERYNYRERETGKYDVSPVGYYTMIWMPRYYDAVAAATDDGTGAVRDVAKCELERVWWDLYQCINDAINGTVPSVEF